MSSGGSPSDAMRVMVARERDISVRAPWGSPMISIEPLRVERLPEAILPVEPVGVPREQGPEAQALEVGMAGDRGHELLADAAAAMEGSTKTSLT